ncbi:MAG: toxic anion resistance protein [Clostridia bacterium]|nr:toxic anion resistance protein [Clostridia bacterium]
MSDFVLELPNEEEIREKVEQELRPTPEKEDQITALVRKTGDNIINVDLDSQQSRHDCVSAIDSFGVETIKKSQSRNAILQKRMYQFSEAGGESGEVSKGLTDLTLKMRDLDPSKIDFLKSGPLGKIFKPVRRYFERYKSADQEISEIIKTLDVGKKNLQNDNVTLELEQNGMREVAVQLRQNLEIAERMDAYVENGIAELELAGDQPEKVTFLQEEVLYPLRQKIQDFQQLQVVNQQGIVAMEIIRRNNKELIRSVERAKLVTVSALRTAVTVAGALYDQKIVLEKVGALNAETNRMIEATSTILKEQGAAIHQQAEESGVSVDTLRTSFENCMQALEDISAYKQEALPRLKANIEEFRALAEEGEKRIARFENGAD